MPSALLTHKFTWVLSSFCPVRGIRPSWSKLLRMTPLRQGYVVQAVWQKCLVPRNDTALFVPYTRLGLSPDACFLFFAGAKNKKYRCTTEAVGVLEKSNIAMISPASRSSDTPNHCWGISIIGSNINFRCIKNLRRRNFIFMTAQSLNLYFFTKRFALG